MGQPAMKLPPGAQLVEDSPSAAGMKLPPGAQLVDDTPQQAAAPEEKGYLDKEIPLTSYGAATEQGFQTVGRGLRDAIAGTGHMIAHPIDTLKSFGELPSQAAQVPAAVSDINKSADPVGTYAKVAQKTAGEGAGQALFALGTEGLAKSAAPVLEKLPPVRSMVTSPVRLGARTAEAALNQKVAPIKPILRIFTPADEAGSLHMNVPGRDFGLPGAPEPKPVYPSQPQTAEVPFELRQASPLKHLPETGAKPASVTGEALGIPKEPAPVYPHQPQGPPKPAPELLQANSLLRGPQPAPPSLADALGKLPLPKNFELPEAKPVFSTTKLGPETPPKELLQANSLTRGPQPAPQLPGAALGGLPVPKLKSFELPQPGPMPKAVASKTLQSTLNAALDAKPTVREGVPMREQMNPEAKPVVSGVPEDHTPVESSAVKSFKYDSQAKELHVATPDGTTYVYGDAEPSAAQNLRDAQSKGKAWKTIRDDHPLVAKIVNGKRIAVKPSIRSATPGPGDGPLLDALQESLKQAQAARAQR